ncbi:CaiB/BaiF CoA transferase family protein [Achromobacter deleyi]|uniref:CaiB/BaiF CoA transferase family protein n=1 Tax=Achromobacter deleyi TaxID=1353891 RepID=UPI001490FAD7|nr:CaiB/BaiF CoA-transferase family protein [Achromobacter deleyi]QVQ28838.1 CoA transferase [Achromobacter deleyi]UIP18953.1 CoA transferase [Achromobacter deleyi]
MTAALNPLDGITVVALEHAVAAPFASRQLADLGARVIKIERPGVGDFARGYDGTVLGLSSFFVWANRGKESLCLNLEQTAERAVLQRLLGQADVFIQNLAPGATQRKGLDFPSLHAQFPKLIVCDISGYGDSGPFHQKKAYDLLIQAAAGLISVTGAPDAPARTGISIADISAGMYAYSGILTALLQRARTGAGLRVEVTMLEALAEWMSYPLNFAHYGGSPPARNGVAHPAIAPYGQYPAGDGKDIIFGLQNEREWVRFCVDVLQDPAVATDERFSSNVLRVINRQALDALIAECFAALSRDEVLRRLDEGGIANSALNSMHEVWDHPQLAARGRWRDVATPAGPIRALLPPATLSGTEAAMGDVPALGQHTEAILAELGIDLTM